jgi:hypothetical protein
MAGSRWHHALYFGAFAIEIFFATEAVALGGSKGLFFGNDLAG